LIKVSNISYLTVIIRRRWSVGWDSWSHSKLF